MEVMAGAEGTATSFVAVSVVAGPMFPAASVRVTEAANVPSSRPVTLMLDTMRSPLVSAPVPVTAAVPPLLSSIE